MKKRGLEPTDRTFTSLFNAFASAPIPSSQLERVYKIQKVMEASENIANAITYNALIQALVECEAEIDEPFEVYDTMKMKKLETDSYTYCYLLKACSKDKKNGISKALKVWEEMHLNEVPNNIYSNNMLLQVLRNCDLPPDRTGIENKIDILGGLEAFLDNLAKEKIIPNITTFDLLSYIIPYEQLGDLIKITVTHKIDLDVAFMNSLLRRQVMEGKQTHAKVNFEYSIRI